MLFSSINYFSIKMRQILFVFFLLFISSRSFGQVPRFDKLEMLYAQGHYKVVYRKAKQLLDIPDYDYSQIPSFYKSLSLFQLVQNANWLKRHPNALEEARDLFIQVKSSGDGLKIFNAHMNEVAFLKSDINSWLEDLKREGKMEEFNHVQLITASLFDKIPGFEKNESTSSNESSEVAESSETSKKRNEIIEFAKKQIGVPYVWAGNDPTGFDCSGFTSYVMKEFGKTLPRRAVDQEKSSRKVKQKNAQKGDLVFFDNGSGISHVGMIVSEKGAPLQMIHASSSKGVIITDITKSEYWLQRLYSFGTYVE